MIRIGAKNAHFSIAIYTFNKLMLEWVAGAKWSREILSRVLIEAYDNGDMPIHEALAAADGILGRNALEFYKLEGRGGFSASTDSLSKLNAAATAGYAASVASMDRTSSFQPRLPPSLRTLPQSKSIKLDSHSQLASPRAPKVDLLVDEKVPSPWWRRIHMKVSL